MPDFAGHYYFFENEVSSFSLRSDEEKTFQIPRRAGPLVSLSPFSLAVTINFLNFCRDFRQVSY
jgi:hypothetical protein